MARWTTQQVLALASDDRAVKAARSLARPGSWSELGSSDALVWGRCQGSGKAPYQVSVDLTEPAFRCSCPSRKFPCKHGLALLLMWVDGDGSVADTGDRPAFVAEWADQRSARADQRSARASKGRAPGGAPGADPADGPAVVDPAAQAKRLEQRRALMTAGLDDLERWLDDLVRQGLAAARQQPYSFWDQAAARLVDAQLPGLAERLRDMGGDIHRRADWADHLLAGAGRWFLAARAWRRWDELDEAAQGDLRVVLGWPTAADDVLAAGAPVTDQWLVAGVHRTDDGRLRSQRTWLRGTTTARWALLLDFAIPGVSLGVPQTTGAILAATVAFYPGSSPNRALFATEPAPVATAARLYDGAGRTPGPGPTVAGGLDAFATALAANPWVARVPVVLAPATVAVRDGRAFVVDAGGMTVPLAEDHEPWPLLAHTGGHPSELFGEWEDGRFRPLTVAVDGELVPV